MCVQYFAKCCCSLVAYCTGPTCCMGKCIERMDLLLRQSAATLRCKMHIKLAISSNHSIPTPGQAVQVLTLQCKSLDYLDQGPVSWRLTTVKWQQSNRHSIISTRQTEYHEASPSSANNKVRCDCTFADDGNASWYLVCRVSMVEWWLDCRHLTVVGLHDTGPRVVVWWLHNVPETTGPQGRAEL